MPWICRLAVRRPRTVIALAIAIVAAMSPGIMRLHLRTDGHALLPHDSPGVIADRRVREAFHLRDQLVVLIRTPHDDGIFNGRTLELIRDLTSRLIQLPNVDAPHVTSLATEKNDRVVPGTLDFRTFLDVIPQSPESMGRLRRDVRAMDIYHGTLVSKDERAACILVGVRDGDDRQGLYHAVRRLAREMNASPDEISVVGAPVAESLLGAHILEDLGVPSSWLGGEGPTEAPPTGFPASLYELRRWIAATIGLVPLAVAAMACVFLAMFRRVAAAVLPLLEVAACLVFVFSLMGWLAVPVYLTIAVMPIILAATGITDEIHVFNRYRQIARQRPDASNAELAAAAIGDMWRPVVKTSVTTAVAFLSFAFSELKPVQAFGIFCAIGCLFCMMWSLTFVPACLSLIPRRRLVRADLVGPADFSRGEWWFSRLAEALIRRRGIVLILAAALLLIVPFGVSRVVVQDSWIDGFSPESEFHRTTRAVNEGFFGTHLLTLEIASAHDELRGVLDPEAVGRSEIIIPAASAAQPGRLVGWFLELRAIVKPGGHSVGATSAQVTAPRDGAAPVRIAEITSVESRGDQWAIGVPLGVGPLNYMTRGAPVERYEYRVSPRSFYKHANLQALCELSDRISARKDCAVGGVLGPCEYLETLNYAALARREGSRRIPDDTLRIDWLWGQYEKLRSEDRLRQLLDESGSRCLVNIFLNDANYVRTAELMNDIRNNERELLAPLGLSVEFAGDVAASQALIQSIVRTQIISVIGSLIGILVVTSILGRSLKWGLLAVLPCTLAVASNFAVMGWLGIPIGVATSMFAAMTLGIGVDHAIHLIERFRREREAARSKDDAVVASCSMNGPAIATDALAICLGFGMMILSQVPSNARLGILLVVCDLACVVGTLVLLPAILAGRRRAPAIS